jgi:hypothetical protein
MANKIRIKSYQPSRSRKVGVSKLELERSFQRNLRGILDNLEDFVNEIKQEVVPEVLVDALEPTLAKAISYCPAKSGELRDSAYLEVQKGRGGSTVALGFGKDGQPDYTVYVHEMPYRHESPTRPKFLEVALDEDYYSILNSIPGLIKARAGT